MSGTKGPLRILVVGQTPPPVHGQAVMVQRMLEGSYQHVRLFHVRMAFSDEIGQVGRFQVRKLWVLFRTIIAITVARVRYRTGVLYYPPSGPSRVPVLRDIALLIAVRWMFRRTVFHFHAGGVSGYQHRLPLFVRPFFRWAYYGADLAMRLAPQAPEDGRLLRAKDDMVVVNGIPDDAGGPILREKPTGTTVHLLLTAVLIPSKGVKVLLEAFAMLRARNVDVDLALMGQFGHPEFERECHLFVQQNGIEDRVRFLGLRSGEAKNNDFRQADIFCFPSFYENEVNPVVLMEAMGFSLPVVSTVWRGIPAIVPHGEAGLLVEPNDPVAFADAVLELLNDRAKRKAFAVRARRIFEERFTLERHLRDLEEAFLRLPP